MFHLENYQSFKPGDYVLFACLMVIVVVLIALLVENLIEMRQNHEQTYSHPDDASGVDESDD